MITRNAFFCWAGSLLLFIFGVWSSGDAGTTGKITGTVKTSDGTPLPGVAIEVVGLRLGAMTDADGRYLILLVPPGECAVRASMMGFRPVITQNVEVSSDRTTTVNFTLREEAIEVAPLVVTAGRPNIEVDVTSSQTTVDARRVAEIPVGKMLDALGYEPGVSVARDNELSIRGGGPSE
ncbi:MAG TPA: carboxypeptidase regulatory-like domain-containing protein, partial [Candidatus Latescibacteria bacterium]|nr:carboxypeptidase regulatory-like domain-containing protein [Candidatus Latescibacterota bacterium]HPK76088.1 carboxypeptidase regulatory-like domain-containing protein [Candidatus Latescibacterota bacterium]